MAGEKDDDRKPASDPSAAKTADPAAPAIIPAEAMPAGNAPTPAAAKPAAPASSVPPAGKAPPPKKPRPADDDEDEDDDEDDEDDDEEDDDEDESEAAKHTYSAAEALGAFSSVWHFVRPFLGPHKLGIALVLLGLCVETAFNVIMPISLKFLIDDVLGDDGERSTLFWILGTLGAAGIITSLTAIWYERKDADVSAEIIGDIRQRLFEHIQTLSVGFYHRVKKGEVLSRFSVDMAALEEVVLHAANWGLLPLMELTAGVILLAFLNWKLALVAMLIFPLTLLGPRFIAPRAVRASYDQKVNEAATLSVVQENIGAQTVVKAFGLQRQSLGWFNTRNRVLRGVMARATFLNTMVERSITISVLMLHLLVFGIGAYLTFTDQITLGTFITFESVFWEISYNIAHVTQYIPVVIEGAASARHMNDLLQEPSRHTDKPDATEMPRMQRALAFEKVAFSYDGTEQQLRGLDLVIPAGRRIAVVGPSGAGKSTLLNLILRLYDPDAGRITIDDVDISDVTRDSLRAHMAIVFQENVLFNMTLRENIRLGRPDASDEDVVRVAKAAEIHKFIKRLPEGYDTMVGERGDTLSGGQRQRIAIARAILRDPALLLLDEATSALDHATESAINKTLKKLSKGRTVIFVTHRLTAVTDMDEIIVMEAGEVVERGRHAELLKKNGVYADLWHHQSQEDDDEDDDEEDEE